jgi:HNH endonuclease
MRATRSLKPKSGSRRKRLTLGEKHDLLMEAGYRCGNPRCLVILAVHILQDHHIVHVSEGGGNQLANLLALCPNCHVLYHANQISREAIRHWKGLLVALNHAFDRRGMELLRFLYETRNNPVPLWHSADGVLQFASLIAAGLVRLADQTAATPWQLPESRHQVVLSERGSQLIEAGMAGDEKKYLELVKATGAE